LQGNTFLTSFVDGCHNVKVERFSNAARLFCPVQDGYRLDGGRQRSQEVFDREWAEEMYLEHTHLLAFCDEIFCCSLYCFGA
jgi:hypothetical protein